MANRMRRNHRPAANLPASPLPPHPQQQPQFLRKFAPAVMRLSPLDPLTARTPPLFKSGADLDIFLLRFRAHARLVKCPAGQQCDLFISLLDNKTLSGVMRTREPANMDLEDLIAQVRRAESHYINSESFINQLRNRKRLKNEPIWDYYVALYNLAARAYPRNEAMRQGSLRETFIANINHSYIGPRLRELPHIGTEELLHTATLLYDCQIDTTKPVNMVESVPDTSSTPPSNDIQPISSHYGLQRICFWEAFNMRNMNNYQTGRSLRRDDPNQTYSQPAEPELFGQIHPNPSDLDSEGLHQ